MKNYAVIDTNVLVSAMLNYDSVPGRVLQKVSEGLLVPILHAQIISEYEDVLRRPKFHWGTGAVDAVLNVLKRNAIYADAKDSGENFPDEDDRIFYEVVLEERTRSEAYLVTGNIKDFPIKTFVVTPRQMLDILER